MIIDLIYFLKDSKMKNYIHTDIRDREWIINAKDIDKFILIRTDNTLSQAKKSLKFFNNNIDKKDYKYKIVKRYYNDHHFCKTKYVIIKIFNTIRQYNEEKERNKKIGKAIKSMFEE